MNGILDIEHDSVARACARRESDRRIHRDVVALIGVGRLFRPLLAVRSAVAKAIRRAGARIDEYTRARNDFRILRRRHRHLDHFDAE